MIPPTGQVFHAPLTALTLAMRARGCIGGQNELPFPRAAPRPTTNDSFLSVRTVSEVMCCREVARTTDQKAGCLLSSYRSFCHAVGSPASLAKLAKRMEASHLKGATAARNIFT